MTSIKIFVLSLFSALLLCDVLNVKSFRLYSWTQTGQMFCTGNATKKQTEDLMKCDKLMRPERKTLLETCLKETVNYKLTDDKPRICSYFNNEKDFTVMDCMFNKTYSVYGPKFNQTKTDEEIDEIEAVENDYDWCLMKSGSIHNFEHLCDMQLNDTQIKNMKNCKNLAKEMIAVLDECRAAANLKNENKPSICDYYENIAVQKCWIKKTSKMSDSDKFESKLKYIECLSKIGK